MAHNDDDGLSIAEKIAGTLATVLLHSLSSHTVYSRVGVCCFERVYVFVFARYLMPNCDVALSDKGFTPSAGTTPLKPFV